MEAFGAVFYTIAKFVEELIKQVPIIGIPVLGAILFGIMRIILKIIPKK